MSRFHFASLVCVLSLSACVINEGGGPNDQDDNDDDNNPDAIVPQTGQWYYADVTEISSTCAAQDNGVAGGFVIDSSNLSGFHVIPGDGTNPFSCSLSGSSFDCPNRALWIEDLRPSADAVLTAHATADGSFSSPTAGTGSQDATVNCQGAACAAAGTFPCSFTVNFRIRAN